MNSLRYKSLDFINFPNYKIDYNGNLYSFKFSKSGQIEEQCLSVKDEFLNKNISKTKLIAKYKIAYKTFYKIINSDTNTFWIRIKPFVSTGGYARINLYNNRKMRRYMYHRLVCEVFHGPCPLGMECRHLDGNQLNNHPDNLCWSTHQENIDDKRKHNSYLSKSKNKKAINVKI